MWPSKWSTRALLINCRFLQLPSQTFQRKCWFRRWILSPFICRRRKCRRPLRLHPSNRPSMETRRNRLYSRWDLVSSLLYTERGSAYFTITSSMISGGWLFLTQRSLLGISMLNRMTEMPISIKRERAYIRTGINNIQWLYNNTYRCVGAFAEC